jgi:hypothetical protein
MDIRKIAIAGGFAIGAALTLAPLASADTPITSTVDSEITSLNSAFTSEVELAGIKATDVLGGTTPGSFEYINPLDVAADAPKTTVVADVTPLEYEVYGFTPTVAGIGSDTGAFDLYNGAAGEFDNFYNVGLYALENGGAYITPADSVADLIQTGATSTALATGSLSGELTTFLDAGFADLSGFFGI